MRNSRNSSAFSSEWVEHSARMGYAVMGFVYLIVGYLALRAAFGHGHTTGPKGTLSVILEQPFGRVLLLLVAAGLFGSAVWRLLDAVQDLSSRGSDPKGLAMRTGSALRAIIYAGFGLEAARAAYRGFTSGSGDNTSHWTSRILKLPYGHFLVMAIGLGVIGYGIWQIIRASRPSLSKHLSLGSLSASTRDTLIHLCRFGMAARGAVFLIIGYFLIHAGRHHDASEARGVGGALGSLRQQHHGKWELAAAGLGLLAYACYQFVNSRYRRIKA